MNRVLQGTVWKCGDNITAYQIITQKRWTACGMNQEELGKWAFEGAEPGVKDLPYGFRDRGYDIVIAGKDFGGGGKSNEHPVLAMKGAGVKLIIAESFSRYNYRNAINLGLPALACPGITKLFNTGERIEVDLITGQIKNLTTGSSIAGIPLNDFVLNLIGAGGLLKYFQNKLASQA